MNTDGSATISGLLFSLVGAEPQGFDVDNIRFGLATQIIIPNPLPEPACLAILSGGPLGLSLIRRRRNG